MNDLRVVIDNHVVISAALLPRSIPRQAFDLAIGRCCVLVSEATLIELEAVLRRPKFAKYITEEERLEFLTAYLKDAEIVNVRDVIAECCDPRDDKFLELAVSGSGTHIVSGDADLHALHPFRGIAIVTPREFISLVTDSFGPSVS
jgi:putative PIN family toxin of toxin-antitoxin system